MTANGTGLPLGVMKNVWNWIMMVVAQRDGCTECHFKMVNFMCILPQ